jgi:hypothetical protein
VGPRGEKEKPWILKALGVTRHVRERAEAGRGGFGQKASGVNPGGEQASEAKPQRGQT